MYRVKTSGRANYEVFDPEMHAHAITALRIEGELREAIARDEFKLDYQPIVSLKTGEVSGFEALLRWRHPKRGLLEPDKFLEVAQETGLIVSIGRSVLRRACEQMHAWQMRWPKAAEWFVSINLCSQELAQPGLVKMIDQTLDETGLAPSCLKIEVTESSLIDNLERSLEIMKELRARGIQLSIDDFGILEIPEECSRIRFIVHATLSLFGVSVTFRATVEISAQPPLTNLILKIDRSFIEDLEPNSRRLEIVQTIITLAHNLGLKVVAEGSETQQALDVLRGLPCEYAQGHSISKPQDAETLSEFLEAQLSCGSAGEGDHK